MDTQPCGPDLSAPEALILTSSAPGQLNVTRVWPE